MAPKKQAAVVKIPLGRPGNNLKLGIIGVPNCGKTTLHNALTKLQTECHSQPFQTTAAHSANVKIPDDVFNDLCHRFKPKSEVPAAISVVDTCGIVGGSTKGEGMGMQFISNIQMVDGVFMVVRAFESDDVVHLDDTVDAVRDIQTVHAELREYDLGYTERQLEDKIKKASRQTSKELQKEIDLLQRVKECLAEGKPVRDLVWTPHEVDCLIGHNYLTAKQVVYVINLTEADFVRQKNKWLAKVHKYITENDPGAPLVPVCATFEEKIVHSTPEEAKLYMEELKATKVMRERIIGTGYSMLKLFHFFTVGEDEVRAWTIREATKAPQAAGVIHTDMEKGFQSAEVYSYDDLVKEGPDAGMKGEAALKAKGLIGLKGKDYVLQPRDIMHVKFNATKKK